MYAVKGGELREVTRFKKAVTRHPAVVWCPFCDTSYQLSVGDACPNTACQAKLMTDEEAAGYRIVADAPAEPSRFETDEEAAAADAAGPPEVVVGVEVAFEPFDVYALTVTQVRDLLPQLDTAGLDRLREEEQLGKNRIGVLEAIDKAAYALVVVDRSVDSGVTMHEGGDDGIG